jgi:hypothetical protein
MRDVDLGMDMSWRHGNGRHGLGDTNVDGVTGSDLLIPSVRRRAGRDRDVHGSDRCGRTSTELSLDKLGGEGYLEICRGGTSFDFEIGKPIQVVGQLLVFWMLDVVCPFERWS